MYCEKTGNACVATRINGQFVDTRGRPVKPSTAVEMGKIGIPPSYTNVCVMAKTNKLRATAKDKTGRLQYFYGWKHKKDAQNAKYTRIAKAAKRMGPLREKFRQLMRSDDSKEKAVGLSYIMMDEFGMRPGKKDGAKKGAAAEEEQEDRGEWDEAVNDTASDSDKASHEFMCYSVE